MKCIKWASDVIRANIKEARDYIRKAYEMKDTDRAVADWCKEMAAGHIQFNGNGHAVVTKLIEKARIEAADNPLTPGMMAVYNAEHADLIADAAEVKAMIDNYGK